jgi:hypothetical protein
LIFKKYPTRKRLQQLVFYKGGRLYWKDGNQVGGGRKPGARLGTKLNTGYIAAYIDRKPYQVHRLIWILHFGKCDLQIDHVNGVRHDNRLINLRKATQKQNSRNMRPRAGRLLKGVFPITRAGQKKWFVTIGGKYKGSFRTKAQAAKAYNSAAKKHFGKFAWFNK